jgi:hypothetical protein
MKRLVSYEDGIKTFVDKEKETWHWSYEYDDVDPHLDYSRALQNDPETWRRGVKKDMIHYGHVPPSILMKWHHDGVNINSARALVNMLNRPEWSYLKCVDKIHIAKE